MTKSLATVAVEVLVAPGCAHGQRTVELVRDVLSRTTFAGESSRHEQRA